MTLLNRVREWWSPLVDGKQLLREAEYCVIDGQECIVFTRGLNSKQMKAIREAWDKAYRGGVAQTLEVIHEK